MSEAQDSGQLDAIRFLTIAEVALLMRVSKMTVYRLVHSGQLAAVRVGRSYRVPEHAIHGYLKDAFADPTIRLTDGHESEPPAQRWRIV
ncbi:MAG: helix-turn-helix domain-containing protein [Longispora sp.]|nr:helix-turn-helix domain-containing protein [Longispora sp. (in: high G+C Gram-positive bacteria)]